MCATGTPLRRLRWSYPRPHPGPILSSTLVEELVRLPGFRNIVIHEYVALDLDRVVEALDRLEPIEQFGGIVRRLEAASDYGSQRADTGGQPSVRLLFQTQRSSIR